MSKLSSSSSATCWPIATTSTDPLARFRKWPFNPSRVAALRARKPTPWTDPETRAENIGPVFGSVIVRAERFAGLGQYEVVLTRRLQQAACVVRRVRARAAAREQSSRSQIACDLRPSSSCFLFCFYRVISPCVGLSDQKRDRDLNMGDVHGAVWTEV